MSGQENNKPKLSVIFPVCNAYNSVVRTIQSLRASGFKDWEMIIVNAGSTDGTGTTVTPLLAYDKRLRYLYQSEPDILRAARQGVQMARGETVMIISADDNCMFYNIGAALKQLEIMPGLEAVVGREAASGTRNGMLIMRTEALMDTALLYSRLEDFKASTLYRKLTRAGVMFGFVKDNVELIADAECSLFVRNAARRISSFGRRTEMPAAAGMM